MKRRSQIKPAITKAKSKSRSLSQMEITPLPFDLQKAGPEIALDLAYDKNPNEIAELLLYLTIKDFMDFPQDFLKLGLDGRWKEEISVALRRESSMYLR